MTPYEKLLLQNKAWVQEKTNADADFFKKMVKDQRPEFLWISCSDSRVPSNEITNSDPGEMFVHRNVANMVVHTDLNLLSVLQYAVEVLEVDHVIVCGHYGCGGVKAAMGNKHLGLINKWLRNIKDIYRLHEEELEAIKDEGARLNRLVELNVHEQVMNLAKTSVVQQSWKKFERPVLHGWVYSLEDGIIKDLYKMMPNAKLDDIFMFDFE